MRYGLLAECGGLVFMLAGLTIAQETRLDPDTLDLRMDVSQMSVEDLRLYRNAVFARYCRYFRDGHLRSAFRDYQEKKCGAKFYWQEPETPFDSSVLTPAERRFVETLARKEKELRSQQVRMAAGEPSYDRRSIVNFSQFSTLSTAALERLQKNGFVVLPAKHEQLFHVYELNDYRLIPSFVTTDSVLQLYHLYFDFTLRQIESEKLLPAATSLARGMRERLRARLEKERDKDLSRAIEQALLYFTVAESLLSGDNATQLRGWMSESMQARCQTQMDLIAQARTKQKGPLMGTVDYTMFKPRGHYTRSAALKRYFKGMMWLSLPGFVLDESLMPLESALIVAYELTHDTALMAQYDLIYEPTGFYVGPSDDITPALARAVADEICGAESTLGQWAAKKHAIARALRRRNPVRIQTQHFDDRDLPQLRFMGMRYVPDSEILQRLTHWPERAIPMGLDVFGVMGVGGALDVLRSSEIEWKGYWPMLEQLQRRLGAMKAEGESNLYWRWMHLLKVLNQPAPSGAAPFMRTEPWAFKNLNTGLASWAELRHDTILYVKPSGAECGGEEPPRVVGYVEARPDFFAELRDLQQYTLTRLREKGLLTSSLEQIGNGILSMFDFLVQVSRKEVKGHVITDEEFRRIQAFGGELEHLTVAVLVDRLGRWDEVSGPDRFLAVAADVHTAGETALEEAVGYADELYALVEIEGYLYLTRGAVFSYYEFLQPASERLTDEEWQKRLRDGNAPARPSWSDHFLLDEPAPELPEIYFFHGC